MTVAVKAELTATIMLFQKLRQSSLSEKSLWYHFNEKPVHLILEDSLNEEITRITSGRKRNIIVTTKTVCEKEKFLLAARLAWRAASPETWCPGFRELTMLRAIFTKLTPPLPEFSIHENERLHCAGYSS